MPITESQLERRKNHIGSSDMAAILGLDPFRTAYDIWLEKTGRIDIDESDLKHQTRGKFLETAILNWFESVTGQSIVRNQYRSAKNEGIPFGSNCDALIKDNGQPIEAKSVGAYANEIWGEPGTDEMPDRVIVQGFVQMICTDAPICHVPVYLPYKDFCLFQIEMKTDLANYIIEKGLEFWNNFVKKDVPPENVAPSLEIAKRIRRQPNKTVSVSQSLYDAYHLADENLKAARKKQEKEKALMLAALDGAEEGITETGLRVTNFVQQRKGYTVEATEYAVLRFPKK